MCVCVWGGVSSASSAAFGKGGEEAQKLGLFWCLGEQFWFVSRDAAFWASIDHVKQKYNCQCAPVLRPAPENTGFPSSCDDNAVREDSALADS